MSSAARHAPSPMPATSNDWYSCGAGTCGLPKPDPAHYQQITLIVAQPASASGMATFRISATFVAETLKRERPLQDHDGNRRLVAPRHRAATDGGSGAGGEPDAGSSNDSGGTDSGDRELRRALPPRVSVRLCLSPVRRLEPLGVLPAGIDLLQYRQRYRQRLRHQ